MTPGRVNIMLYNGPISWENFISSNLYERRNSTIFAAVIATLSIKFSAGPTQTNRKHNIPWNFINFNCY